MLDFDLRLSRGRGLDRFTLDVAHQTRAGVLGVFGPSGSGKTTLLHSLAGLALPDRGYVRLGDEMLFDNGRGDSGDAMRNCRVNRPAHARSIGLVFQDHRLFPHKTVLGNLRYGMPRRRPGRFSIDQIVNLLQIDHLLHRPARRLSGGQAARVALGRAILASPRLLLLDEPMTGMDAPLKHRLLALLLRVKEQLHLPMVVVSHDLDVLLHLADELLLLVDGTKVGSGPIVELVEKTETLDVLSGQTIASPLSLAVLEHRRDEGYTLLRSLSVADVPRGPIIKARAMPDLPVGAVIHGLLPSDDVSLSRSPLQDSSLQNQFRTRITRITRVGGRVFCRLDLGPPILAELTARSVDELGLVEGCSIWCSTKASSLRCLPTGVIAPSRMLAESVSSGQVAEHEREVAR